MKKYIKIAISFVISIVILILIFKFVPFTLLLKQAKNANYTLVLIGIIIYLSAQVINAYRWQLILISSGSIRLPFYSLYKIIMMSLLINNTIPARLGELSKGFFLVTNEKVNIGTAFTCVFTERLLDLITVLLFFITSFMLADFSLILSSSFPHVVDAIAEIINKNLPIEKEYINYIKEINIANFIKTPIYITSIILILSLSIVFIFRNNKEKLIIFLGKVLFFIPKSILTKIERFLNNIKFFKDTSKIFKILISSIFVWTAYLLSFVFFFKAFHIDVPSVLMPFIVAMSAIGISIPAAPGGIGPFEVAISLATALAVDPLYQQQSNLIPIVSCAFILHFSQLISTSLIGFYFLMKNNFSFFKKDRIKQI